MKTIYARTAAVLAFAIGAMAVFAGGKVLLGQDPGYYVIGWLPVYNFTLGVVSVALTAPLIWRNSRYAMPAAFATLAAHAAVMLTLLAAYRQVVAPDSLVAMTLRITTWSIIVALLWVQARGTSSDRPEQSRATGA